MLLFKKETKRNNAQKPEQVRGGKIAFLIAQQMSQLSVGFLTRIGLQRLAMPFSNTTTIAIALVSDTVDVLLPRISNLVKGTSF